MTIKTSDLCDACSGAQACALPFLSFGKKSTFAGDIRTVQAIEGIANLRQLVNEPGDGKVLVIDAGGLTAQAVFGDVMAERAVRNGWAGVIVNGMIRDATEINGMSIGIKALGTFPRRAGLDGGGDIDITVQFGGLVFAPGRRLVADADGVVVLPEGMTELDVPIADSVAATAAYAAGVQADGAGR